jgi:ferritin-like metal-binding protein YciE
MQHGCITQHMRSNIMTDIKEHLADWLRDAYAMEKQAVEMLERMAGRIQHYPELKERVTRHLTESKHQADRLETCLGILGEDTSALKTTLGKVVGMAQALSGMFVSDEIVKASAAGYVFEHYEIANYKVLIAAAEAAGEMEIAAICSDILREEEAMADWLQEHLPHVVQTFLAKDEAGLRAKR